MPTREERDERRRKGLCMWCGQRYTATHNCVKSQLYQLLTDSMECNEEDTEVISDCVDNMDDPTSKGDEVATLHTISLQAYWGTDSCNTMRMQGKIKNQSIIVLVDTGSTHNFMDSTIAKRLGCRLHHIQGLHVTVANGDTVRVQEACQGLSWTVQGIK